MLDMFTGAGAPLSQSGFDDVLGILKGDPASLWSILTVETRGFGFMPDKRPKILFERHVFAKRTGGRYSLGYPDISNATPGGYSATGPDEYGRLAKAMVLDRTAALESASWGLGQIMGYNAKSIGFPGAEAMVTQFKESEDAQLLGTANFIAVNPPLAAAFREKRWQRVAFYYNGAGYAKNSYDTKLNAAYVAFQQKQPDLGIRAAQARLNYLGYNTKGVDGVMGSYTASALTAFQRSRPSLIANGTLDNETIAALKTAAGA